VRCEDLALDIWITPDGRATLLDEDEFAALNLPEVEQIACQRAATAVIQLAANGELPC
jgi:predicted RNA-binding protein associated with RNAse of E/G family